MEPEYQKTKIHGLVYLVIGIAMIAITLFVQSKVQGSSIVFFIYVGIVFLIIGIYKLVTKYILGKEKNENITKELGLHKRKYMKELLHNNDYTQNTGNKKIILCPNCSAKHYDTSNYCHKCGTKLIK